MNFKSMIDSRVESFHKFLMKESKNIQEAERIKQAQAEHGKSELEKKREKEKSKRSADGKKPYVEPSTKERDKVREESKSSLAEGVFKFV